MKKIFITILCIFSFFGGIVGSIYMMNKMEQKPQEPQAKVENEIQISDKVTDECVEEYETVEEEVEEANSSDIKKNFDEYEDSYMLRDVDGKICVYELDEEGNENLLKETEIATEYLTETDKINIENGIIVYGKENLNKLMEDFE